MDPRKLFWNKIHDLVYEKEYAYNLQIHYAKIRVWLAIIFAVLTSGAFAGYFGLQDGKCILIRLFQSFYGLV